MNVEPKALDAILLDVLCALGDHQAIEERGPKSRQGASEVLKRLQDQNRALREVQDLRKEIAALTPKRPKTKKRYQMYLESVGNPDFGQYDSISEPEWVEADTLTELRKLGEDYRGKWDMGGGNWACPVVLEGKKVIGNFSYNGRLWKGEKPGITLRDADEIVIKEGK
jgi:hypothetical protein